MGIMVILTSCAGQVMHLPFELTEIAIGGHCNLNGRLVGYINVIERLGEGGCKLKRKV
jgi:hypothetical protein